MCAMPSGDALLTFSLASLVLIAIPGPSVLFVIGRSLALGRRAGLLSVLGNGLGALPLVFAVAIGIGAVVAQSLVLFTVIKVLGAGYLIYLGVQAIRHRRLDQGTDQATDPAPASAQRTIGQGFLEGVTNPKTIVFFVAVLPQFVDVHAGWVAAQMMVLSTVFILLAFIGDGLWALLAGGARTWFASSPARLSRLRVVGGGMMIGLGGILVTTGHKA